MAGIGGNHLDSLPLQVNLDFADDVALIVANEYANRPLSFPRRHHHPIIINGKRFGSAAAALALSFPAEPGRRCAPNNSASAARALPKGYMRL
jgi:hypothetical protein